MSNSIEDFAKLAMCYHLDGKESAIKVFPNSDTLQYVPAEWIMNTIKELQMRDLTGTQTDLDLLVKELLRSTFN